MATGVMIGLGATVNLNSLTIVGGASDSQGGGIENRGMLTVARSIFSGNRVSSNMVVALGAGVYNSGTLSVTDSSFVGNNASGRGGGIDNEGKLTVTNSSFSSNDSPVGAGISDCGTATIINSAFSDNHAFLGVDAGGGGGFFKRCGGPSTVIKSTFVENTTNGDGGAILNGGALTVVNSAFSNNFAACNFSCGGGAIGNFVPGTLTVVDSSFSNNGTGATEKASEALLVKARRRTLLTVRSPIIVQHLAVALITRGRWSSPTAPSIGTSVIWTVAQLPAGAG
jgi:hypothetical protein